MNGKKKQQKQIVIIIVALAVLLLIFYPSKTIEDTSVASTGSNARDTQSSGINPFSTSGDDCSPDGSECCDSGWTWCDWGVCGSSEEWCENYNDGGAHCKPDDPDWCCDDAGYIYCQDDRCGPTTGYCENLYDPKHCKDTDLTWCCLGAGDIFDYYRDVCCISTHPFANDGSYCYSTPRIIAGQFSAKNYYTQHSDLCNLDGGQGISWKCEGDRVSRCYSPSEFIYEWGSPEMEVGACGVECLDDSNCPSPKMCISLRCEYECVDDSGCLVGVCEENSCVDCRSDEDCEFNHYCSENECIQHDKITFYRFVEEDNKCINVELYPYEVTDNDYMTLELCEENIQSFIIYYLLGVGVVIALYLVYIKQGKKWFKK